MAKNLFKNHSPFAVFFFLFLTVHLLLPLDWGDDKVFSAEAVLPISEFLKGSSRILTDTMTYIFNKFHFLWRLINPCVLTFLAWVVSKLLSVTNYRLNIALCLCVVYPTMVIVDAGFIATTVNYLWPVTFGLYSLLIFQRIATGHKLKWYILLTGIPAIIYSLNMEQMSAVLAACFFIGCVYLFGVKKRFHPYPLFGLVVSIAGLLYAYLGNTARDNSRMIRETARYFPDFAQLGLLQKAELGYSSTMYCLTCELRFAFFAFAAFNIFLIVMAFRKRLCIKARVTAVIPLAFSVICTVINTVKPFGFIKHFRVDKAEYLFSPLFDILYLIVLVCVLYTVSQLLKDRLLTLKIYTVLAAGAASRMLMGFSPTVWASGYRTFCIMFLSFIITAFIILNTERTAREGNLVEEK